MIITVACELRNFTAGHGYGDIAEGVTGHGTAPMWIGSRQHRMLSDGSGLYRVSIPAIGTGQPFGCPAQPTSGTVSYTQLDVYKRQSFVSRQLELIAGEARHFSQCERCCDFGLKLSESQR